MKLMLGILVLLVIVFAVVALRDMNRFRIDSYHVKTGRLQEPVKLVFLSDLHDKTYGPENEKLLAAIDAISPRAILVGGDMLTAKPGRDVQRAVRLIGKLTKKYPVYYGSGNHEQRLALYPETYGDMSQRLEQGLADAGVVRLRNSKAQLLDLPVDLHCVEIKKQYYKRGPLHPMEQKDMTDCLPVPEDNGRFQILLAHDPEYFGAYKQWGADLVLSGHVHGGIVRLPFVGGVASPRITFFPKYSGGEYKENGKIMIVSRGLGVHTIPLRLFNPGEVSVIMLE